MDTKKELDIICSLAVIFAFIFSPIGIILGIVGLIKSNKLQDKQHRYFSIWSIVVGTFLIIIVLVALIYFNSASPSNYVPLRS